MKALRYGLLLILIFAGTGDVIWQDFTQQLHNALPITHPEQIEVPLGKSLIAVFKDLHGQGVITSSRQMFYLRLYARVNNVAAMLKAGEYEIKPGMSAEDVISMMHAGRVMLHELTIIEGWTFAQLVAAVNANPNLQHSLEAQDAAAVMTAIGKPGIAAEGHFYPDTYLFPKGTADVAFLRRASVAMDKALTSEWDARDPQIPFKTSDDALILASIIEKETGAKEERAEIAGVFIRRLALGMRLQTDPTVIYGMGLEYKGNLRRKDLETDTPFNTYTRFGLPPTPICMPGRASIHAALHPTGDKTLFFVARGDGTHKFSETLQEQDAAVRQYQLKIPPPKPSIPTTARKHKHSTQTKIQH